MNPPEVPGRSPEAPEQDLGLGLGLDVPASLGLGLASNLVLLQSKTKTKISQKHNLFNHIQSYTGEKSFKCNFCLKAFSQNGNLINHKISLRGKETFKCNYCDIYCGIFSKTTLVYSYTASH